MPDFRDVIPGTQISAGQASLTGLQAELAASALSSAALTGFYLQRIDLLNPALHAVITVNLEAPAEAVGQRRGPRGGRTARSARGHPGADQGQHPGSGHADHGGIARLAHRRAW